MIANIDYRIIDSHAHIGYTQDAYRLLPEEIIGHMDRLGIEKALLSSFEAIGYKPQDGNEHVFGLVEKYPDRFCGYIVVNPHFIEGIEAFLDEHLKKKNIIGIKLHPSVHQYPPSGPNYLKVYEYADKHNTLLLNHSFGSCKVIEEAAATFPNMKIIVGHGAAGTNKDEINHLGKVLKSRKNIFFDTSSSSLAPGGIEYFVDVFGSEKVIFGTDAPFLDPAFQVGRALYARIGEKDRYLIMRGNIEQLIG